MRRLLLPALLLALPLDAAAYIDPGTGSLILQGLIAAFAAAAFVIRGYWYRIKALFRRKDGPAATGRPQPGGDPE